MQELQQAQEMMVLIALGRLMEVQPNLLLWEVHMVVMEAQLHLVLQMEVMEVQVEVLAIKVMVVRLLKVHNQAIVEHTDLDLMEAMVSQVVLLRQIQAAAVAQVRLVWMARNQLQEMVEQEEIIV